MTIRAALHWLWATLSKPREPLLQSFLRQRITKRAIASAGCRITPETDYDSAIRDYLVLWLAAQTEEEHYRTAFERFGLDQEGADFVDQVLCSASLGTLGNWGNSHDDPWWQAAWRLSRSRHRYLLCTLRNQIQSSF